jgi:MFS family permease
VFLLGALSDLLRADIGLDEAAIGAAVTVLFVTSAVSARPIGGLTERLGAVTALRTGVLLAGGATAAIGLVADRWWHVAVLVGCCGLAVSMVDTGAARAFADRVPVGGQGRAFGIKEASVPAASLVAGVALPVLATPIGWRAAFATAPVVALLVLLVLPGRGSAETSSGTTHGAVGPSHGTGVATGPVATGPVTTTPDATGLVPPSAAAATGSPWSRAVTLRFATGVGVGAGAANAAATFLVPAATGRGVTTAGAGWLLVAASAASIVVRLAAGTWADGVGRRPIRATSLLAAIGAVGAATLAISSVPAVTIVAALALLGGGWGWTGLAFLAAVRARPGAPAAAAGVVLTGLGAGGAFGPLAFGALAAAGSSTWAWAATAVALTVAAVLTASVTAELDVAPA